MMLNTIVRITPDVASGLQNKTKLFALKNLRLYDGENGETAVMENMAVCTCLFGKDLLPSDAVKDIITGLSLCDHENFSKVLED